MVFLRVHALYLSVDNLIHFCPYNGMRGQQCYVTAVHSCVMYSAWKPKDKYDMSASVFVVHFLALCHSQVSLMLSTDINITENTYFCQF